MSNSIEIRDDTVVIPKSYFKPEFLDTIEHSIMPYMKATSRNQEEIDCYLAYWFITGNFYYQNDNVVINFGRGNSGHTTRDFMQTIDLICRGMKEGKINKTFRVEDTGFPGWFDWEIIFTPGLEFNEKWDQMSIK